MISSDSSSDELDELVPNSTGRASIGVNRRGRGRFTAPDNDAPFSKQPLRTPTAKHDTRKLTSERKPSSRQEHSNHTKNQSGRRERSVSSDGIKVSLFMKREPAFGLPDEDHAIEDDGYADEELEVKVRIKKEDPDARDRLPPGSRNAHRGLFEIRDFGLREEEEVQVEERWSALRFRLSEICSEFGGSTRQRFQNWDNATGTQPYLTLSARFAWDLPLAPGKHGVLYIPQVDVARLDRFDDGTPVSEFNCFFKRGAPGEWWYGGIYKVVGRGEVKAESYHDLPEQVRRLWSRVARYEDWGRSLIEKRNQELSEKLETQGWSDKFIDLSKLESVERDGFATGLLTMPLVILKCVGFDEEWYERMELNGYPPNKTYDQRRRYVAKTKRSRNLRHRRIQSDQRAQQESMQMKAKDTEDEVPYESESEEEYVLE